jgi:2-keto-myo-inositol isomerase
MPVELRPIGPPAAGPGPARFALHTWTLDTTPLPAAIAAARTAGYDAMELRWTDFKRCTERGMANEDILGLVRAGGLPVGVLGVEYGWLFAQGGESRRLFDVFRLSCRNAASLGCAMLMSAPGPNSGPLADAIANLRAGADIAAEHGLRLAIEFNSQHDVINNLSVQRELVAAAGRPNCGLLLDAYHLARSGAGGRSFADVPGEQIFVFQYSDVPAHPVTGVKRPIDRLPPGAGTIPWRDVFGLLAEKDYAGYLSYEAPNPALWARPPEQVAREGLEATRRLFAEAALKTPA